MTKSLFILAGVLFLAMMGALIGGLTASSAGLMMLSFLCAGPLFMLLLGMAVGRATFEFTLTRNTARPEANRAVIHNSRLNRAKEGSSSYGS